MADVERVAALLKTLLINFSAKNEKLIRSIVQIPALLANFVA